MKENIQTRAELHLYTNCTTKDAMMSVYKAAKKAKEMNLSAIAIADHGNVQCFPDAEYAAKKYGIKIIYGMECSCVDDLDGDETTYDVTLLVKNKTGLKNLYRLISLSHLSNCCKEPPIPKSLLIQHREGLLVGASCNNGGLTNSSDDEAAQFYDYFEISPAKDLRQINLRIADIAEKSGKPVIATSNARYLTPEYQLGHKILRHCFKQPDPQEESLHFLNTEEMLEAFSYLGEDLRQKAVFTNTQKLADMCEEFDLFPEGQHFPIIKGSAEKLVALCKERVAQLYGENPPAEVMDRLQAELDIILPNKYDGIYMLTRELAHNSLSQGYPVVVRGCGGNSFVSFLLGITDFNPLPSHNRCTRCGYADFNDKVSTCTHCGREMVKDGFDLPCEVFLGVPEKTKIPDFDLCVSKDCWKSTEKLMKDIFGGDRVCYAGVAKTIGDSVAQQMVCTYAYDKGLSFNQDKIEELSQQLLQVRINDDFRISGHVIIPPDMEVTDFCPIQHCNGLPTVITQLEYYDMSDTLYAADVFINKYADRLYAMSEETDVAWQSIPLNDAETFKLICSGAVNDLPEFNTKYAREMVKRLQPHDLDGLVRIICSGHATGIWEINAELLIKRGIPLKDIVSSRDDVMLGVLKKGLSRRLAYNIMEDVRKGRGITDGMQDYLKDFALPEWFVDSCNKARYLCPKSHCISSVLQSYRLAWYRTHFPDLYGKYDHANEKPNRQRYDTN